MRHELDGWRSVHGRGADGSIESDERVTAASAVVERSEAGARLLGERYWREVASASRGLVRGRRNGDGVELRLFARGPSLLRFGMAKSDPVPAEIVDRARARAAKGKRLGDLSEG